MIITYRNDVPRPVKLATDRKIYKFQDLNPETNQALFVHTGSEDRESEIVRRLKKSVCIAMYRFRAKQSQYDYEVTSLTLDELPEVVIGVWCFAKAAK